MFKRLPVIAGSLFFGHRSRMGIRMRALIFLAGGALALAACRGNQQGGETANVDQTLAAGAIASNDVTAIDAVSGEDANMAADVALINALDNGTANATSDSRTRPAAGRTPPTRPAPETSPATANTSAAATANNAL